jgi:UPF0755 protein
MTARPSGLLKILIVAMLGGTLLAVWAWYAVWHQPLHDDPTPRRVLLERGVAGPAGLQRALGAANIDVFRPLVWLALRSRQDSPSLRAGTYEVPAGASLGGLLDRMGRGERLLASVRVVEGLTFRQMRRLIDDHPDLQPDTRGLDDAALLRLVGVEAAHPEGLFFPNTYVFSPGDKASDIYRQAHRDLLRVLAEAWEQRHEDLPLAGPHQALILASMVEKETGAAAERAVVAGVFINRLRRGMLLQSDPTTIYGLGARFDGNLRRRDLQELNPWNTYARPGLPATPIALVGRESLMAAVKPAATTALYFVARGDGSSEFSNDLAAHQRAVNRYQLKKP